MCTVASTQRTCSARETGGRRMSRRQGVLACNSRPLPCCRRRRMPADGGVVWVKLHDCSCGTKAQDQIAPSWQDHREATKYGHSGRSRLSDLQHQTCQHLCSTTWQVQFYKHGMPLHITTPAGCAARALCCAGRCTGRAGCCAGCCAGRCACCCATSRAAAAAACGTSCGAGCGRGC